MRVHILVAAAILVVFVTRSTVLQYDECVSFERDNGMHNVFHNVVWYLPTFLKHRRRDMTTIVYTDDNERVAFRELFALFGFRLVHDNRTCTKVTMTTHDIVSVSHLQTRETLLAALPQLQDIRTRVRREWCADTPVNMTRVLFVKRSDRRRVLNIDELLERAQREYPTMAFDMVRLEHMPSLRAQVQAFCSARIVVGGHGAGLTWSLFMNERAALIELFPYGWADPCYRDLTSVANVVYFSWQCTDTRWRGAVERGRSSDYVAFIPGVLAKLRSAIDASAHAARHHDYPCPGVPLIVDGRHACDFIYERDTSKHLLVRNVVVPHALAVVQQRRRGDEVVLGLDASFIPSLRATGYRGPIVTLPPHADIVQRTRFFIDAARACAEHARILVVSVDVVFQTNPFVEQFPTMHDNMYVAMFEEAGDQRLGRVGEWMRRLYGPTALVGIEERIALCAGVVWGRALGVAALYEAVMMEIKSVGVADDDRCYLNYLVYHDFVPYVRIFPQGFVNRFDELVRDAHGRTLQNDGRVSSIVYQDAIA